MVEAIILFFVNFKKLPLRYSLAKTLMISPGFKWSARRVTLIYVLKGELVIRGGYDMIFALKAKMQKEQVREPLSAYIRVWEALQHSKYILSLTSSLFLLYISSLIIDSSGFLSKNIPA